MWWRWAWRGGRLCVSELICQRKVKAWQAIKPSGGVLLSNMLLTSDIQLGKHPRKKMAGSVCEPPDRHGGGRGVSGEGGFSYPY